MNDPGHGEALRAEYAQRGLGRRPRLRLVSAVLWASFLGASLSTVVLLLTPDSWTLPPTTVDGAARVFVVLWLLALVPATFAAVLTLPFRREP
ncbi:MAG: hypothetical protein P4L83_03275 [Nevskia sp.]|nr:hypothetical protein [Nevskia sp.]